MRRLTSEQDRTSSSRAGVRLVCTVSTAHSANVTTCCTASRPPRGRHGHHEGSARRCTAHIPRGAYCAYSGSIALDICSILVVASICRKARARPRGGPHTPATHCTYDATEFFSAPFSLASLGIHAACCGTRHRTYYYSMAAHDQFSSNTHMREGSRRGPRRGEALRFRARLGPGQGHPGQPATVIFPRRVLDCKVRANVSAPD